MSTRWRIAGHATAGIVFVYTLAEPAANPLPFLAGAPVVVLAAVWALAAFAWVWLIEGAYLALGSILRRFARLIGAD